MNTMTIRTLTGQTYYTDFITFDSEGSVQFTTRAALVLNQGFASNGIPHTIPPTNISSITPTTPTN